MYKKQQVPPKVGDNIFIKWNAPFAEIKGTTAIVKELAEIMEHVIVRKGNVDYYLYQDEYELIGDGN